MGTQDHESRFSKFSTLFECKSLPVALWTVGHPSILTESHMSSHFLKGVLLCKVNVVKACLVFLKDSTGILSPDV